MNLLIYKKIIIKKNEYILFNIKDFNSIWLLRVVPLPLHYNLLLVPLYRNLCPLLPGVHLNFPQFNSFMNLLDFPKL